MEYDVQVPLSPASGARAPNGERPLQHGIGGRVIDPKGRVPAPGIQPGPALRTVP
jgi:hypothetical protein